MDHTQPATASSPSTSPFTRATTGLEYSTVVEPCINQFWRTRDHRPLCFRIVLSAQSGDRHAAHQRHMVGTGL